MPEKRSARTLIPLILLLLWSCTPLSKQPSTELSPEKHLAARLNAILENPILDQCTVGMHVVRLSDNRILFARNQTKLMHPASTMKLFTTAFALEELGGSFQYTTSLATENTNSPQITELYLQGSGDPSLTTDDLAALAKQLQKQGIRQIDRILYDASFLDDIYYGQGWMWDDQPYKDFAPVCGLSLNKNIVEIHISPARNINQPVQVNIIPQTDFITVNNNAKTTRNSQPNLLVTRTMQNNQNTITITGTLDRQDSEQIILRNIENPALYTATVFMEECQKLGITVTSPPHPGIAPQQTAIIASHQSAPLAELILEMNKNSHNIYAELLLKTGAAHAAQETGSTEQGLNLLQNLLQSWDISEQQYHFADGSGVSRYNLVTPEALTDLLIHIYNDADHKEDFIHSLPIGGYDGDLDWRMKNFSEKKNVQAKTGYLSGVSTLAGFIETSSGETLAFSIMMQHFQGSATPFLEIQDTLCEQLSCF
jgi:D-alanyl-D-alanine carboxypeptidase/D-alanyl-D-alanine-endopeptidase (penicillin-binding protein 4)